MDVPTLSLFLRPILTVTSVWNTRETGDIHYYEWCWAIKFEKKLLSKQNFGRKFEKDHG